MLEKNGPKNSWALGTWINHIYLPQFLVTREILSVKGQRIQKLSPGITYLHHGSYGVLKENDL